MMLYNRSLFLPLGRLTRGTRCSPARAGLNANSSASTIDWAQRRRQRLISDLSESCRKLKHSKEDIARGLENLEALLPGLEPNLETMKASEWVSLLMDPSSVAQKLVALKMCYPGLNLSKAITKNPKVLLLSVAQLETNAVQVKQLLATAKDPDNLIEQLPVLMDPKMLISVLVTVKKWYHLQRDPVEVIEKDPDLINRAQDNDVPFEPVYIDEATGQWMAPQLNYAEKRTEWQAYIDRTRYKQP